MKGKMPPEVRKHWQQSLAEVADDRTAIEAQAQAVFSAETSARDVVARLKQERQRRGLSLADILERTGMSREALSRLENNDAPNPTLRTLARYAAAVGLELRLAAGRRRS